MREVGNATAATPGTSTNSCSISTDSTAIANTNDSVSNLKTCTHYNNNNNHSSTNTYNGRTVENDNIPDDCDRVNDRDARIIFQDCDGSNIGYNKTSDQLNLDSMNLNHLPTSDHNHSPIVSIRSLDSSIIESDSDVDLTYDDADLEEVNHNGCIVTELNSEMTYPPNHPKIPKINNGLTLINQEITPDSGNASSAAISPLNKLSIIGDELGKAQSLGTTPSSVATPKIGSVAVSNSTDITFGDKHFYEGPVTIQQFLIDNRNKLKQQEEEDKTNNMPQHEHGNQNSKADTKSNRNNSASDSPLKPFAFLRDRRKYIVAALLFTLALIIIAAIYGRALIDGKSTLRLVTRNEWFARPHRDTVVPLSLPVERVIVSHTASDICKTLEACIYRLGFIQNFHMDSMDFGDIGYNFLLGSDGRVYEGQDNIEGGNVLRIVPRDAWLAQIPVSTLVPLDVPVQRVIIVPTYTSDCDAQSKCTYRVRMIQTFNIESQQNDDIVYNFLIGGDGNIYEGRGWFSKAAAVKGYNDNSITVAFIGTFHDPPAPKVLNIAKLFLAKALRSKKLTADYKIVGANQLDESFALGTGLYKSFESWPHWSQK
uniref:Peptidoglycan recognition protein family domain-containing protein n=1 Tax=Glossina pallidipes TaxID=7398 RepID=A0A1A9Z2M8_GLOPL